MCIDSANEIAFDMPFLDFDQKNHGLLEMNDLIVNELFVVWFHIKLSHHIGIYIMI